MAKITQILAREILNSRGNPAIETTVILNDNQSAVASCPSGTSVGKYEAIELIDKEEKRFGGKGVRKAISNIENIIAPALLGMDASSQNEIDKKMIELDATENKSNLGANTILAVSMVCAKAAAASAQMPLYKYLRQFLKTEGLTLKTPSPTFNILNGGKHAGNNVNFQEFLLIPISSKPFSEALEIASSVYYSLKKTLEFNNLSTLIGDEGGFGPRLSTNIDGLSLIKQSVSSISLRLGFDVFLGLDAASNNFFLEDKYHIKDKNMALSTNDLIGFYESLNNDFHLLYLEDPLAEDDWDGWTEINRRIGQNTLIVGDDLIATNPLRLQMALNKKAVTGIIIKPNQIGTVIEALAVVEVAHAAGLKITVSHRSGETNDDFIADFAVAVSADYVKFGAPATGERVAKYNRLLEIEKQIKTL